MFKAARIEKIKEIILKKKQIDVSALSQLLSVTEVTVRSDLEALEKEGFIRKTHGGATLNENYMQSTPLISHSVDKAANINADKEYIAKIASCMIKERDVIFLGSGDTCASIAKTLIDRQNIIVVTNNLTVANILADNNKLEVIVTGGNLDSSTKSLTGELVQKSLEDVFVHKAFVSVSGIDKNNGYTVLSMAELNVYKFIIGISKELIVVADSSKFDTTSFVKLGPVQMAKKVITNENIPGEYKAFFFNEGIQVFTSYEIDQIDEVK